MAKINLSIPDELKEQMDALPDVNWSGVAKEAFANLVNIHQLRSRDMNEAGLERLRASRKNVEEHNHADGVRLGKEWALNEAEYDELERVASIEETGDDPGFDLSNAVFGDAFDRRDARDWLKRTFHTSEPSEESVLGFLEGAAEVFDQV